MIGIKVDQSKFNSEIENLFDVVKSTASQKNLQQITRAATAVTAKSFIKDVNSIAKVNPKSFHHLYEWGSNNNPIGNTGNSNKRLFVLKRVGSGDQGKISLDVKFLQSKVRVPVPSSLSSAGNSGKSVVRSSVFRNKAAAMESGAGASWVAKRNIVFEGSSGNLVFRRKGSVINISSMGGSSTTKALENFMQRWQSTAANTVIENCNLLPTLEKKITTVLNGRRPTKSEVNKQIQIVCEKYGSGEREF